MTITKIKGATHVFTLDLDSGERGWIIQVLIGDRYVNATDPVHLMTKHEMVEWIYSFEKPMKRRRRTPLRTVEVKLSTQLKAWRESKGYSQEGAAAELGITLRTLENWEQGYREPRGLARTALLERITVQTSAPKKEYEKLKRIPPRVR